jgi:hypothetical protein
MNRDKLGRFVIGHKDGMTGKKQPESQKIKVSKALTGHPYWSGPNAKLTQIKKGERRSPSTEFKRGQKSWNAGTSTNPDYSFRMSKTYADFRLKVLKRDNYTCQIGGERGGKLIVDHIKPYAFFKDERINMKNARTLCIKCHRKTDTYGYGAIKKYGMKNRQKVL